MSVEDPDEKSIFEMLDRAREEKMKKEEPDLEELKTKAIKSETDLRVRILKMLADGTERFSVESDCWRSFSASVTAIIMATEKDIGEDLDYYISTSYKSIGEAFVNDKDEMSSLMVEIMKLMGATDETKAYIEARNKAGPDLNSLLGSIMG